ncbi:hypothetical protein PFICI_04645 [Pestalotiopsis fici W106-1]|uniref:Uncharacterized protein n=1 Tax=Pestalotiopsis fici (strain W106-1 / CGMCC3.15140) TaxID=1229662 RepID=W3X9S5_PESFW|nr:uncharacterized protein PFICI_04645 [Pestalotiopsis fici W106-1]ETS82769.1 hypothetical protein PFICI_04645 [Pestalotiopsis fici W106-1]
MLLSLGMASPVARRLSRSTSSSLPAAKQLLFGLVALWSLTQVGLAQSLPYVPTTILLPNTNSVPLQQNVSCDVAYIFSPTDDSVSLLALNISSTIKSSDLTFDILSSELPFLASGNASFTPSIANNGTLIVYAGNCSSSSDAGVWTMDPPLDGSKGNWTQSALGSSNSGPGYLGAGLSFSTTLEPVMGPMDVYIYGGMCPGNVTDETLAQSEATYSNQMLRLSPSDSNTADYAVHSLTNKGAPIAEAGFTFTGLSPSISNRSGTVTQQANYVVLGGHTESAFVNISTAAIWSLPEESWGYVSIGTANSSGSTELAIKSTSTTMDPRSGHTAVLNEDGSALVILGGWVGNTQTAASPQLAILDLGLGYGGNGDWQWTIPEDQPSGSGIYGHGAALLPGNVMMVYGGYQISSSGSNSKRQTSTTQPSFLNLTSMSWSEDYTNPTYAASAGDDTSDDDDEDAARQLGLGLGLGLGFGAIILAILAYFLFRWRHVRKYSSREDIIRSLAQDTNHYLQDEPMMEHDGQDTSWYLGGHDPYMTGGRSLGYQSLQGGRGSIDAAGFSYTPAPMLRKPVPPRTSRGHYMPAPVSGYDSPMGHRPTRSGGIHPIYEADEETQTVEEPITPARDTARDSVHSDPFLTPVADRPLSFPQASHVSQSPGNESRPQTDPDVQDWMSDVDAADALLTGRMTTHSAGGAGRTSPVRRNTVKSIMSVRSGYNGDEDARTNSNLSDSSRGVSRSGSQRSHLRLGFGVSPATAAAEERSGTSSSDSSQPSYHTAKSIPTLQAEGPSLLLGRHEYDEDDAPGSPSKNKPRLSRGWLGSLRRVFSGSTPSSASPGSYLDTPMRDSMAGASDYDPQSGGLGTIAAGGLFRRKGGRGAWEAGDAGNDDDLPLGRRGMGDGDDEWDIEKAVEKRLVQVMFTVPREPLRIVNGEPDIESGESVVVIDPDTDERVEMDEKRRYELRDEPRTTTEMAESSYISERQPPHGEEVEEEDVILDKGKQRDNVDSALGSEIGPPTYIPTHRDTVDSGLGTDSDVPLERTMTRELEGLLPSSKAEARPDSFSSLEDPFFSSPSIRQRSRDSQHSDAPILSAQAVQLKRPERAMTRVLAMVESIESRSRSASPDRP